MRPVTDIQVSSHNRQFRNISKSKPTKLIQNDFHKMGFSSNYIDYIVIPEKLAVICDAYKLKAKNIMMLCHMVTAFWAFEKPTNLHPI